MPELKRNFLKGRMNKDLDERLISNGEYRDALNIQVSTSEGSNVGTAQNVKGNLKVGVDAGFSAQANVVRLGVPTALGLSDFEAVSLSGFETQLRNIDSANTVGSFKHQTTGKVYNFVNNAVDLYTSNNISPGEAAASLTPYGYDNDMSPESTYSGTGTRKEGIRYDAIFEYTPSVNDDEGTYKTIFRDVYEVRFAPQNTAYFTLNAAGVATDVIVKAPMHLGATEELATDNIISGFPTETCTDENGNTYVKALGVKKGMRAKCIGPNGDDLWGFSEVRVTDVPLLNSFYFEGRGAVIITSLSNEVHYNTEIRNAGYVIQFTSDRVLNFESGNKEVETNTTAQNSTFTPKNKIITGINIIDDLLFFTDGRTEPKKINIKRSLEGTDQKKYSHTRLEKSIYSTPVSEEHVTVIKKNPTTPPLVELKNTITRSGDVYMEANNGIYDGESVGTNGNVNALAYYSEATTSIVRSYTGNNSDSLDFVGGLLAFVKANGDPNQPGDQKYIYLDEGNVHWRPNDEIKLTGLTTGSVVTVRIRLNANGTARRWSEGGIFRRMNVEVVANDPNTVFNQQGEIWFGELADSSSKNFYDEKFVSFAYRYKYIDGEISCISPYSTPAFLPGRYSYNSLQAANEGMENNIDSIVLKNFVPSNISENVQEIQLLYRDHEFDTTHIFKTVEKGEYDFTYSSYDSEGNYSPQAKGCITINTELFGQMIPVLQLDRIFDDVPISARAQEFSAGRLMFGNYIKDYNITNPFGEKIQPSLNYTLGTNEFQTLDISYSKTGFLKSNATEHRGNVLNEFDDSGDPVIRNYQSLEGSTLKGLIDTDMGGTAANGEGLISNHKIGGGLERIPNILVNSIPELNDDNSDTTSSDGKPTKAHWPIGTWSEAPGQGELGFGGGHYPEINGLLNNEAILIDKNDIRANYELINQLDNGSSWYNQAVNVIEGVNDFNNPKWWGRWKFKINFSDELIDAGNIFSTNVITPEGVEEVDFDSTCDISTSMAKLDTTGTWKIRTHCSFKCSRTLADYYPGDGTSHSRWGIFKEHPARLAIYRCDDNGVPFGLPLAYSAWNTAGGRTNQMGDINDPKVEYNMPFSGQGAAGQVNTQTDFEGNESNITYSGILNNEGTSYSTANKAFRGLYLEADIICQEADDITQQNVIAKNTNICVCMEVEPIGYSYFEGEVGDWTNPWSASDDFLSGLDTIVCGEGLENQPIVFCSINDTSEGEGFGAYVNSNIPNDFEIPEGAYKYIKGNARFRIIQSPLSDVEVSATPAKPSVKSNRSYQVGYAYIDKYGRESSILVDEDSFVTIPNSNSKNFNAIGVNITSEFPIWAKYYKYYIREIADRFYNVAVHKMYDNNDAGGSVFAWLSFNSAEINKIQLNDKLLVKKKHGSNEFLNERVVTRVVDISNQVPVGSDGADIFDAVDGVADSINEADQVGKFFVKVKLSIALKNALIPDSVDLDTDEDGSINEEFFAYMQDTLNTISGAVVEVLPKSTKIETEQDELFGFFYEASQAYPIRLNGSEAETYIPIGSTISLSIPGQLTYGASVHATVQAFNSEKNIVKRVVGALTNGVIDELQGNEDASCKVLHASNTLDGLQSLSAVPIVAIFTRPDGSSVRALLSSGVSQSNELKLQTLTHGQKHVLSWNNCYAFGNGVESDSILDVFNETTLYKYTPIGKQSGFKTALVEDEYKREHKSNDIIFSQLYNENRGVDGTNQFIAADNPIKKLAPAHGSIQKLFARDNDLLALCENKILRILSSGKDALFNADGNMQVLATANVLGQAIPFVGDYGISKNPESFAADEYRCYFTDRDRGAVLRLSRDGLTPINLAGMKDWFADNLKHADVAIGSFDGKKDEYNISIHSSYAPNSKKDVYTLSFNEGIDGWVSFKSFIQESGCSLNNKYYTFKNGGIYLHHPEDLATDVNRNLFYSSARGTTSGTHAIQGNSTVTPIINDSPDTVKSFKTLNYEGSQAKIILANADLDGIGNDNVNYFDNYQDDAVSNGWYVESITTDLQDGQVTEFIKKENKWFNYIQGTESTFTNNADSLGAGASGTLDFAEFSTQGVGTISSIMTISGTMAEGFDLIINSAEGDGWSTDGLAISNITEIT